MTQRAAWSRTPPRPTAGSWCRSPTKATRRCISSAIVSSASAVSWSNMPASSTTRTSSVPAGTVHPGVRWAAHGASGGLVPSVAVLVDEPGSGEGVGLDLLGSYLGGLEGGGHHDQFPSACCRAWLAAARVRVLPTPACALDDQERCRTRERGDHAALSVVEAVGHPRGRAAQGGLCSAHRESLGQVRLDVEHTV